MFFLTSLRSRVVPDFHTPVMPLGTSIPNELKLPQKANSQCLVDHLILLPQQVPRELVSLKVKEKTNEMTANYLFWW